MSGVSHPQRDELAPNFTPPLPYRVKEIFPDKSEGKFIANRTVCAAFDSISKTKLLTISMAQLRYMFYTAAHVADAVGDGAQRVLSGA